MNLHEAWEMVISEIRQYIKGCFKEGVKPDYDYIQKYAKERVRQLYQLSN